jgi:dienelactone hydrolase
MTDHAVLIPTAEGPVGGIVSEPGGRARAALLLLGGYGRPARSGINSFWTRIARRLAGRGVVTLRVDYSREGETLPLGAGGSGQAWKRELDLRILRQAASWFRGRAGLPPMVAGSCSGSRFAIELAGQEPDAFADTFLIVPHLREPAPPGSRVDSGSDAPAPVDPLLVDCLETILARRPSWILVGEHDLEDVPRLLRLLPPTAHGLDVEILPGVALHFLDQPHIQDAVALRLVARILKGS